MRLLLISLVAFFQFASAQAAPYEITTSQDSELIKLLNNVEVVVQHTQLPIMIRVFKVRDHGECDASLKSCPKESIYIATSSFDEYPDQNLYVLPKTYGWEFKRWVSLPSKDSPDDFAVLEIVEKCLNENSSEVSWVEKRYHLYVNTAKAKLEEK